jgi:hypothetical protein
VFYEVIYLKTRYQLCIVVIVLVILTNSLVLRNGFAQQPTATQYHVVIDSAAHQRFGLYYPVTYMFEIPSGSSSLSAQYRYDPNDPWIDLDIKTSTDFFNGVNAVRFDYSNDVAYLSIAFSTDSDVIYLRILDGAIEVPVAYTGIPEYYDNRHAAVTLTLDNLTLNFESGFDWANFYITSLYHLHYTAGIWSQDSVDPDFWSFVQGLYNDGYMEPGSQSRTNPYTEDDYLLHGYDWEITGSRDDILTHLTLQYPYVPAFIEPHGIYSPQVRQAVINAHYLVERGMSSSPAGDTFSAWGSDGAYERVMYSYGTDDWPQGNPEGGTAQLLAEANARFDTAYAAGGIYHLKDDPGKGNWFIEPYSYLLQHIAYISNRLDVWYAAFGELYLYHFVQERGLVFVSPVTNANESFFYGEVQVSNNPPQAGDFLSASVAGVSTPFTTTLHSADPNLVYDIGIPCDSPTTPEKDGGVEGDEVIFRLGTRQVAKGTWHFNTVQNLDIHPPALTVTDGQVFKVGDSKSFALGSFTDPGADNPWHVEANWGDGTPNTVFDVNATGALPNQMHTYGPTSTRVYTVQVTITDNNGGIDNESFHVREGVIFLPLVTQP